MRLSLGSVAAVAAALLVAFAFWPQQGPVRGPQALFAQNKKMRERPVDRRKPVAPKVSPAPNLPVIPRVTAENALSSDVGNNPRIEGALDATADFMIDPQPIKDALDFIAQRYQVPIILDNKTLEGASIDTTTEVKMPVQGLKVRQLLKLLLAQLPEPLAFEIQDGVLQITTLEKIRERRVVVVYDCRDLINLRPAIRPTGVRKRSQGALPPREGAGMFAVSPAAAKARRPARGDVAKPAENKPEKNAERAESAAAPCMEPVIPLISVIQYAGDEEDWRDEDGGAGKVTELGGLLVVNQNPLVHEQIKRILADLRRMRKEGAFSTLDREHGPAAVPEPIVVPPKGL